MLESSDTFVSFGIPTEVKKLVRGHGDGAFKGGKIEHRYMNEKVAARRMKWGGRVIQGGLTNTKNL